MNYTIIPYYNYKYYVSQEAVDNAPFCWTTRGLLCAVLGHKPVKVSLKNRILHYMGLL